MIVFIIEYTAPHKFIWKPTYDRNDKEPFGSYVFDDVLSSSIENYSVANKTFYQIIQEDSAISQHAFLLTEEYLSFSETDIEYLYKLVHLGNQVMICTESFPYTLEDTLYFDSGYDSYYGSFNIYKQNKRDSIFFGTDTLNPECIFEVYPHFHNVSIFTSKYVWIYDDTCSTPEADDEITFDEELITGDENIIDNEGIINNETPFSSDSDNSYEDDFVNEDRFEVELLEDTIEEAYPAEVENWVSVPMNCDSIEILVWDSEKRPLALRAFLGKGEIFLVSTPLMFTNYGVLDGNNASYIFRLLSCMKGKPLIRVEAYGAHGDKPKTPLRYILSEPPLRWAIYFTIILLISFMVFAAKRRQRIIPVVSSPPNKSIEFMQLISNLYYQKHNNAEILKMKHTYFCTELKSLIGIDLQENIPDKQDYKRLVEKTGIEMDYINGLLKNIQMALYLSEVDDIHLKQQIDGMNYILRALMS